MIQQELFTDELKVPKWKPNFVIDTNNEIDIIIHKFSTHLSIKMIKAKFASKEKFELNKISNSVYNETNKLDKNKKNQCQMFQYFY